MYTMLDDRNASRFDLHFHGRLVASLHYSSDENEILFVCCEIVDTVNADRHRHELMQRAKYEALDHWAKLNVTCPIALEYLRNIAIGALPKRQKQVTSLARFKAIKESRAHNRRPEQRESRSLAIDSALLAGEDQR